MSGLNDIYGIEEDEFCITFQLHLNINTYREQHCYRRFLKSSIIGVGLGEFDKPSNLLIYLSTGDVFDLQKIVFGGSYSGFKAFVLSPRGNYFINDLFRRICNFLKTDPETNSKTPGKELPSI
jgi:hypothetical protein